MVGQSPYHMGFAGSITLRAETIIDVHLQAVESLIEQLATTTTIVIVTHNMQQAGRVSDYTAMMMLTKDRQAGTVIEFNETNTIFTNPTDQRTEDYITGRFG